MTECDHHWVDAGGGMELCVLCERQREVYRTPSGRVLTDADMERLADEAEADPPVCSKHGVALIRGLCPDCVSSNLLD